MLYLNKEYPMPNIIEIDGLSSPGPDVFARLTEAQLRNRMEPEKGIFIAESPKVIALALDAGYEPVSLLAERKQIGEQAGAVIARCGNIPVYTADDSLLAELTGFRLACGLLCAMRRPVLRLDGVELLCGNARRVAVLDSLMDSTNVGAAFRSAAALGIDAVLVTPSCSDPLLRRSVRVSMGTVFQVPWTRIGVHPSEWPGLGMARLRRLGFKTVAMALDDTALKIDDPRLAAEEKLAILFGSEGCGLSPSAIAACDYVARIPMSNSVDSLNVAAASAVAFWQLRIPNGGS
jgi:tRNA G18 (ribose-2'-O)-methylase SpoU